MGPLDKKLGGVYKELSAISQINLTAHQKRISATKENNQLVTMIDKMKNVIQSNKKEFDEMDQRIKLRIKKIIEIE